MKISKTRLQKIIKEEYSRLIVEMQHATPGIVDDDVTGSMTWAPDRNKLAEDLDKTMLHTMDTLGEEPVMQYCAGIAKMGRRYIAK